MQESSARKNAMGQLDLPVEGKLPPIETLGIGPWFNAKPLTAADLKGKVVVIDFWTYSCINCLRSIPYVKAWDERYRKDGLVVIGVHAPEFAFEHDPSNVAKAVKDLGIPYPVVMDNDWKLWRAPPEQLLAGALLHRCEGPHSLPPFWRRRICDVGAGDPAIAGRSRPCAAGHHDRGRGERSPGGSGLGEVGSPETYIGYYRAERFASPGGLMRDAAKTYASAPLKLNDWSFQGKWIDQRQSARSLEPNAAISFRFHARDLHLVLGSATGKPVRFLITIDGHVPGRDAGVDTNAEGTGTVTGQRLYQLVRQKGAIGESTFTITFLDPGIDAFSFTFG